MVGGLTWKRRLLLVDGLRPPTHQFQLVEACSVRFPPQFALFTEFSPAVWDDQVELARVHSLIWSACSILCDGNEVDASWNFWSL